MDFRNFLTLLLRQRSSIFFILLTLSEPALAFVENVTHGYSQCIACHISPSGGGLLNDYGRSLSKELMSSWGWEGSEHPLFGAFENKENVKFGGDARIIQTYLENANVRQGRQFLMQSNVELGIQWAKTWFVGTFGTEEGPSGIPGKGEFLSERHYALWETSDESRLRIGKFRINFGIYDPNHTRVTKAPLSFGANSETYNLEFTKWSENDELTLTATLGRLDVPRDPGSERAISATYARTLNGHSKLGVSTLVGESQVRRRAVTGIHAIFPTFEDSVVKLEIDHQRSNPALTPNQTQDLIAGHLSFGYAWFKGVQTYVFYEYLQQDLNDPLTKQNAPGIGLQWLPIPHIEVQAEFKKQMVANPILPPSDSGWLIFHFYL